MPTGTVFEDPVTFKVGKIVCISALVSQAELQLSIMSRTVQLKGNLIPTRNQLVQQQRMILVAHVTNMQMPVGIITVLNKVCL